MRRIATLLLIIASAASCATSLPNSPPFQVWEKNVKEDYCDISGPSSVWRKQVFLNWPRLLAAKPRKRSPSILRVRERSWRRPRLNKDHLSLISITTVPAHWSKMPVQGCATQRDSLDDCSSFLLGFVLLFASLSVLKGG